MCSKGLEGVEQDQEKSARLRGKMGKSNGAQQVVRKNTGPQSQSGFWKGSQQSAPPTRPPALAWPSQWRLPKPQALARFPQAQGLTLQARLLLTPPAPRPGCLAAPQCWLLGALATTLPPLHPPACPPQPCSPLPQCSRRRRFPSGLRGRAHGEEGARAGAGRVGGVKVGAQQNHPPLSERPDLRCDLNTGGRARQRRDVAQSSPDAPQHIPGSPVEVSLHPNTREPTVSSRLPGPPGFLDPSSRCAKALSRWQSQPGPLSPRRAPPSHVPPCRRAGVPG